MFLRGAASFQPELRFFLSPEKKGSRVGLRGFSLLE